jgi:DNA helicase HerA-like ATPase
MEEEKDRMIIDANSLNDQPFIPTLKYLKSHMYIIGTTGAGKSKGLENIIRSRIRNSICPHASTEDAEKKKAEEDQNEKRKR